jgi:hypothetical protein
MTFVYDRLQYKISKHGRNTPDSTQVGYFDSSLVAPRLQSISPPLP